MPLDWVQLTTAATAGAGAIYALQRNKTNAEMAEAQAEALAVNTLRDVILELRDELERARARLLYAERLIEKLTGKSVYDDMFGFWPPPES